MPIRGEEPGPWLHVIVGTSRMYRVPDTVRPKLPPNTSILVPLWAETMQLPVRIGGTDPVEISGAQVALAGMYS